MAKILVIDDDPDIVMAIRMCLEEVGHGKARVRCEPGRYHAKRVQVTRTHTHAHRSAEELAKVPPRTFRSG